MTFMALVYSISSLLADFDAVTSICIRGGSPQHLFEFHRTREFHSAVQDDAREQLEAWRRHYNESRPHIAGRLTVPRRRSRSRRR